MEAISTNAATPIPPPPIPPPSSASKVLSTAISPIAGNDASKSVPLSGAGPETITENNGNARLSNTTACLPFIYGSVAFYLGKKADEFATHKWTLYLRGPNHEDLSGVVQKVIFQLHPSFAQPVRELTEPPFEVTEKGWGEFEAQIRILWKDPQEKAIVVNHGLKLYPPGSTNMQPTKEPVVSETYDEAVFTDPKEFFFQSLLRVAHLPKISFADKAIQECCLTYTDEDDFQKLLQAQQFLEEELLRVKTRMKLAAAEMDQVDDALRELHDTKQQHASSKRGASTNSALTSASAQSNASSKSNKSTVGITGNKKQKMG